MGWEGEIERSEPPGNPLSTSENTIKMNLRETDCEGVDWIHMARNVDKRQTVLNTDMNLRFLRNAGNFLNS